MLQQSPYILAVLLLLVIGAEWLARFKFFKTIGSVILVIAGGALLSNIGVIPVATTATPAYELILTYLAPLAIFFLLLDVNLADLKKAGLPMLIMFLLGSAATVAGVLAGYLMWQPQLHGVAEAPVVAGMYTGTYIGGSINLNAIAMQYQMAQQGSLFALVNAVDNLIGTPWMLVTILLPRLLHKFLPRRQRANAIGASQAIPTAASDRPATMEDMAWLLALGFGGMAIADGISRLWPQIPSIITLTTLALVLAQVPAVRRLRGSKMLGMLFVLLFLAVVGAFCDVQAVASAGGTAVRLVLWVSTIILLHGLIVFGLGGLFRVDWDIIAVASNANVGGSTSAPVCAASIGRPDLQVPGILAGSLGNAMGTYIGFWVVHLVSAFG